MKKVTQIETVVQLVSPIKWALFLMKKTKVIKGKDRTALYSLYSKKVYLVRGTSRGINSCDIFSSEHTEIEKESIQKKIFCELTAGCNLCCIHCYGDFKRCGIDELSYKEFKDAIRYFYNKGFKTIQFTGGEAFLRKGVLFKLLRYVTTLETDRIEIFSNLNLLEKEDVITIKKINSNAIFRTTIFSYRERTHDTITTANGSWRKTVDAINLLKLNNFKVEVAVIVMKENYEELEDTKRFLSGLAVQFSIDAVRPSGRGSTTSCMELTRKLGFNTLRTNENGEVTFREYELRNRNKLNSCFSRTIALSSSGLFFPCIFARNILLGDIKKDSLSTTYKNLKEVAKTYSWKNIKECNNCPLNVSCKDCRPLVYSLTGDMSAKNPLCTLESGTLKLEEVTV